ncbi:hypothetical protein [Bacteroides congonensis]
MKKDWKIPVLQSFRLKLISIPIINFKLQIYEKYFNPKGNERLYFAFFLFGEEEILYLANTVFTTFDTCPDKSTAI